MCCVENKRRGTFGDSLDAWMNGNQIKIGWIMGQRQNPAFLGCYLLLQAKENFMDTSGTLKGGWKSDDEIVEIRIQQLKQHQDDMRSQSDRSSGLLQIKWTKMFPIRLSTGI